MHYSWLNSEGSLAGIGKARMKDTQAYIIQIFILLYLHTKNNIYLPFIDFHLSSWRPFSSLHSFSVNSREFYYPLVCHAFGNLPSASLDLRPSHHCCCLHETDKSLTPVVPFFVPLTRPPCLNWSIQLSDSPVQLSAQSCIMQWWTNCELLESIQCILNSFAVRVKLLSKYHIQQKHSFWKSFFMWN